jgi:hypothetical protein
MVLSIQKNFLFIHVPKTAGNSIQNAIKNWSEDDITADAPHQDGIERYNVVNARYGTVKHSTLATYQRQLEQPLFDKLYKFSTVRNPWERAISQFFSPHRNMTEWNREAFLDFLPRVKPLRHFVCLHEGNGSLDVSIDRFIRFESIEQDFAAVCSDLQIDNMGLEVRNRSQRAPYAEYYDQELINLVGARFREEIDWFGYRFG